MTFFLGAFKRGTTSHPLTRSQCRVVGLEADLTSYNAAMTACERGSQWQQAWQGIQGMAPAVE